MHDSSHPSEKSINNHPMVCKIGISEFFYPAVEQICALNQPTTDQDKNAMVLGDVSILPFGCLLLVSLFSPFSHSKSAIHPVKHTNVMLSSSAISEFLPVNELFELNNSATTTEPSTSSFEMSFLQRSRPDPLFLLPADLAQSDHQDEQTQKRGVLQLDSTTFQILVSNALEPTLLTAIFAEANFYQAHIVIKGLLNNKTLVETLNYWQSYAAKYDPPVTVLLDPTLFQENNVQTVPTLLATFDKKVIAKVSGIYSIDWLKRQLEQIMMPSPVLKEVQIDQINKKKLESVVQDEVIDLGVRGPAVFILERDLMAQMQENLSEIDWVKQKQQAYDNFWTNFPFIPLVNATACETHYIDPVITIQAPLVNALGEVIVPSGTRINPLAYFPFTQTLVVFNPQRFDEIAAIQTWLVNNLSRHTHITLIATELGAEQGWAEFEQLSAYFQRPVYFLTQPIQNRFQIKATPSIITQQSGRFVVASGCLSDASSFEVLLKNH